MAREKLNWLFPRVQITWITTAGNNWEFLGETRARRGRELSQILTEELFILGIWECS